jgi:hypothetical protein
MAEKKPVVLGEGYNPSSLAQTVAQLQDLGKALNPAPLSQAVQQLTQGSGTSATPSSTSPSATPPPPPPASTGSEAED